LVELLEGVFDERALVDPTDELRLLLEELVEDFEL
jgi:hypothetical protein